MCDQATEACPTCGQAIPINPTDAKAVALLRTQRNRAAGRIAGLEVEIRRGPVQGYQFTKEDWNERRERTIARIKGEIDLYEHAIVAIDAHAQSDAQYPRDAPTEGE